MDVESLTNTGSTRKIPSISVHQAEVALRLGFLRKVYGILTAQLCLTLIVGIACMTSQTVKGFVQGSPVLIIGLTIGALVSLIALIVMRHQTPINFILLGIFTLSESISLGSIITYYDQGIVIKAFIITTAVFVSLTLYSMQSKYDYSTWGASLFTLLCILIVASFMQVFFWSEALDFVISVGGALIFCGFILFDTYRIMHRHSTEDYIIAAVELYLDFINLFIYILRILDALKNK
ncbi:PREDICTED: protein lifeguard 4-like [Amphimedon queenslandica]|uniref:Transmembrane BAX inhibitor motif-containing protein 4 n=1 Tax=Amphimedon queenslandica TaxID=400682 RepID=A0AAN0ID36_AMPQE|nr:PREDICTED: protein lifeguard 4-like [Amphimedon queenslandica]|eukprot:XP_003385460.1 PREDICTED: protein lifeguard 4-like [Amphimedon queenslandica]